MAKITNNTPEQAIACIQAHLEGKRIRATPIGCDAFINVPSPTWDFANYRYEIVPEPRTIWVTEFSETKRLGGFTYLSQESAESQVETYRGKMKVIRFIEVME